MAKYNLRTNITGSIMKNYGLPIDSIFENGVIYINEKSTMYVGEDGLEHPVTEVSFMYNDDEGNNHTAKLDKIIFDSLFEFAGE